MFLLPVFMQEFLGFTATQSGIALMPRVLVMVVAMPVVGRLYNYVSPRIFVAAGILLNCLGTWMQGSLTLESGAGDVVVAIMVQGLGFSCMMIPLTTVSLSTIPRHRLADATGLNSLMRQLGGAIGLAAIATLLGNYATEARASIGAHLTETNPLVQQRLGAASAALVARGMDAVSARAVSLASIVGSAFRQSMVLSFDRIFLFTGVLLRLAVPLLFLLRPRAGTLAAGVHPE
jgi:MFS transporter, DHA2 family, multidrug resistance protein